MKRSQTIELVRMIAGGFATSSKIAMAHTIHYQVEQKGMTARAYYSEKDAASYSQYELYGPGDQHPHQTGRTDKNGYVAFVPDRPGTWKLQIWGESTHGFHGVTTEIKVNDSLQLDGFSKPLVAAHTKYVTGISLILGVFGIYALLSSKKNRVALITLFLLGTPAAHAHHGGVSLAFGPGSPIETNSPLTLPEGGLVTGVRLEQVEWKKFPNKSDNATSATYSNANISFGFTPALMGTLTIPYYVKRQQSLGMNQGLADIKLQMTYGFHFDPETGFSRNGADDTAVSMESKNHRTWLSLSGLGSIPNGHYTHTRAGDNGHPDRGMQTGFGSPSYTLAAAVARSLGSVTLNADVGWDIFSPRNDQDGLFQYGSEERLNVAGVYELYGKNDSFLSKLDGILELNYLHLNHDKEDGINDIGSGGRILYLSPGMRFSFPSIQNSNLGVLCKIPVWTRLNDSHENAQGSEGVEKFRWMTTLSLYF